MQRSVSSKLILTINICSSFQCLFDCFNASQTGSTTQRFTRLWVCLWRFCRVNFSNGFSRSKFFKCLASVLAEKFEKLFFSNYHFG